MGLVVGLAAALLVGALAAWREWSRTSARQAWHGPAVAVRRSRLRGVVRVLLLAVAAGSATASVIGLTGAGARTRRRPPHPSRSSSRSTSRAAWTPPTSRRAGRPRRGPGWRAWSIAPRRGRLGLVLFAGEPLLTCPLTSDLGALRLALDEAGSTQLAIPGGSILGPAIARSVAAFGEGRARRTLIVVSDGEDTGSGVAEAAAAAKQAGVVVHTVGVGTAQGIAMPVRRPPPVSSRRRAPRRASPGSKTRACASWPPPPAASTWRAWTRRL